MFYSRLTEMLELELDIIGGGFGCFFLHLGTGSLSADRKQTVSTRLVDATVQELARSFDVRQLSFFPGSVVYQRRP